jgi:hypothetical protein
LYEDFALRRRQIQKLNGDAVREVLSTGVGRLIQPDDSAKRLNIAVVRGQHELDIEFVPDDELPLAREDQAVSTDIASLWRGFRQAQLGFT